jgi:hypothetical protein
VRYQTPRRRRSSLAKRLLDEPGELHEVFESRVQQLVQSGDVHAEVSVHQHVAEAGDPAEASHEFGGKDAEVAEDVNGARVVGCIPPCARREMSRDVEGVLTAEVLVEPKR